MSTQANINEMEAKEIDGRNISPWKPVKKEQIDERQYNHTCFRCDARFSSSSRLVQHMKEEHSSFVEHARPRPLPTPDSSPARDVDRYTNTIATCPFCKHDCQTRKKLMRHLELEHKDDNELEEEPQVKVIRIDEQNKQKLLEQFNKHNGVGGPFVTPGPTDSTMVQNLLKAIGTTNKNNANVKVESNTATKFQYKCFWCDASYRKRGKLMDHIDNLHKHNKQAENKMSGTMEEPKPLHPQQMNMMAHSSTLDRLAVPPYLPGLPFPSMSGQASSSVTSTSPRPDVKPKSSRPCSFTLSGSLTPKPKPPIKEDERPDVCKFFLTKKENPLANAKSNPVTNALRASNLRRSSLPNVFEGSSPPYGFPYGMLPPSSMATAMQHRYLMAMRPPMMHPSPFYAPRMPLMMPGSDYLVNQTQQILDQHSQNTQQAQFFARMNAMAQISPLARPKNPESPLDLTKSYM